MLETEFIAKNKSKWQSYEALLAYEVHDPDKLSEIYLELSNDLSFANTHYPNRAVRLYLNNLMQKVYSSINIEVNRFTLRDLLTKYMPKVFYETRYVAYFTIVMFVLGVLIGVISTIQEPAFARIALSEKYIEMTMDNIAAGEPMAVYSKHAGSFSFWMVLQNNANVASNTFFLGILGGVGSLFFLLVNSIMVGSIQTFFIQQGVVKESLLTIWTHGSLEFISIFFACKSGFYLGLSFLFPRTYTRLQSLQIAAKKSLSLIILSIICLFFAALIEGFITPREISDITRLCFIFVPLVLYIWFVFIYPHRLAKRGQLDLNLSADLPITTTYDLTFDRLDSIGSNLLASIQIYGRNIFYFFVLSLVLAYLYGILFFEEGGGAFNEILIQDNVLFIIFASNIIALVVYWLSHKVHTRMYSIYKLTPPVISLSRSISSGILLIVLNSLMVYIMSFDWSFTTVMGVFIFSNLLALVYQSALTQSQKINKEFIGSNLANLFFFFCLLIGAQNLLSTRLFSFISEMISLIIPMSDSLLTFYKSFFIIFASAFILFMVLPILYLGLGITAMRYNEVQNATSVFARINNIKTKTKYYGMESE